MRRVLIVEKPNETFSYAAVDQQTGEVLLRLRDRHALVALCQRLEWTVEEKSESANKPRQRTRERCRTHQGRARPRVGEATQFISPRKRQKGRILASEFLTRQRSNAHIGPRGPTRPAG
jgi:hypothetical protein